MATVFVYFKRNPYGASKIIFILSVVAMVLVGTIKVIILVHHKLKL
jgi:hypothetical protein